MQPQQTKLTAGENYRAIIEKTGLPYERNLRIIWEASNSAIYLKGLMPRLEKIARSIDGIRKIEVSENGYLLFIQFRQAPFADEIVLGDFLKALKTEFRMEYVVVQCDVCSRIEERANKPDAAEESATDSEVPGG